MDKLRRVPWLVLPYVLIVISGIIGLEAVRHEGREREHRSCLVEQRARNDLRDILIAIVDRSSNPNSPSAIFFSEYVNSKLPQIDC
jgi:hypothetical protein